MLYLSKLVTLALLPVGLALLLGIAVVVTAAMGRRRVAVGLGVAQVGLLYLTAMPWTAARLTLWLEGDYPPVTLSETPGADVAVVLGGAVGQIGNPAVENLTTASDRVLRAARLYRAGKVDAVLAVGGNLSWAGERTPESALMRDLLVEWGVPNEAVLLETRSQNTRQNALFAAEILAAKGWDRVLLVTSAAHMTRAAAAFRAAGVEVIPSPTDYGVVRVMRGDSSAAMATGGGGQVTERAPSTATAGQRVSEMDAPASAQIMDFLPDAAALAGTTKAVRELIGRAYYRLRGWM